MRSPLFLGLLTGLLCAGCDSPKPQTTEPGSAKVDPPKTDKGGKPKPTDKGDKDKGNKGDKNKGDKNNPSDITKGPKPPATFDDAWNAALGDSQKLDDVEPELTKMALAKLGDMQRNEAQQCMAEADALAAFGTRLMQLGQVAWVTRQSRKFALADPEFKAVAEGAWKSKHPPENGILGLMTLWGLMKPGERMLVVRAATTGAKADDFAPEQRTTVTKYLGRDWFKD